MLQIRRANERGHANHGWLDTYHTFSFADYRDPEHRAFRALRVINEDFIAAGQGFGMHPHRDMEILTYVLSGTMEHKDSMGNGSVLRPGEFQRMTAGTGVLHSEFNPSATETAHIYQIWLFPTEKGLPPSYEQKVFGMETSDQWQLIASPEGRDGSLAMQIPGAVYLGNFPAGFAQKQEIANGRHAWLQILSGTIQVNDTTLNTSDGLAVSEETTLNLQAETGAKVLLFDLE